MVATMRKPSAATTTSALSPPFSARVRERPGSSTLLRRSSTASSAKLISSMSRQSPSRIAVTSGPSAHTKGARTCLAAAIIASMAADRQATSPSSTSPRSSRSLCPACARAWMDVCSWRPSPEGDGGDVRPDDAHSGEPTTADAASCMAAAWRSRSRTGRKPPRKSDASVCWLQLMICSRWPSMRAAIWHTVVLPAPVWPTSRAGSA
mmetsp:Transcript_36374/g.91873  ORF Transcript_36374/g.91873 Transcript_36374/m.91873 type:complete len:207 (-) Transcript_36374:3896-4516(-)